MTRDEYERKRRKIIDDYTEAICEDENAGCLGDAETARKWMDVKLRELDEEYGH